jgi:Spy/CpxP family protein refolding chaperone
MTRTHPPWAFVFVAFVAGCQGRTEPAGETSPGPGSSGAPSASAPTSAAPATSVAKPHTRWKRHVGFASAIFHAAEDLTLTDAQRDSMDKLDVDLSQDDQAVGSAMKAFRADLMDGASAGKLDQAKLHADEAAEESALSAHHEKEVAALGSLHGILDASQRQAAVSALRAKEEEREARRAAKKEDAGASAGLDHAKMRLDRLTAELSLDATQQKQVAALLSNAKDPPNSAVLDARRADRLKKMDTFLTAFASDSFDAKQLDLSLLPGKTPREPLEHMATFIGQLVPILHPDQRDKLAKSENRPFGSLEMPGRARPPLDDIVFPFVEPQERESSPR